MEALTRLQRLALFAERMLGAPAARDATAAKAQLDAILNEVEDEFTEIPYDPDTLGRDGRMYPAFEDSRFVVEGRPDLRGYGHRAHETYISGDGAVLIRSKVTGEVLLDKPGANGRHVLL